MAPIFGDPLDVDIDDDELVDVTVATAAAAAMAAQDDVCINATTQIIDVGTDEGNLDGRGGGCDAATFAASARIRLKRGSEVVLARGLHQRGGSGNGGDMDALLTRRRGSLPVEMLSINCSGEAKSCYGLYGSNSTFVSSA